MAGVFPGGGADRFREGIRFSMDMGAAPEEVLQATFLFPSQLVFVDPDDAGTTVDQAGVPFDPDVPVQRVTPDPVRLPCAVEYYDATGQQAQRMGDLGIVSTSRVKVLLLDEEYEQVKGCDRVVIDGDTYWYRRTQPPSGLFDVGIFELWFHSEQET
jgi:hypothetical protein